MTPLTPDEQKMIDRILARGIAANDDCNTMTPNWKEYAAMAGVLLLMLALGLMLHFAMLERVA